MYNIWDAHCDTLGKLLKTGEIFSESTGMVRPQYFEGYDTFVQVFAAWVDAAKGNPLCMALELADVFYRETEKNGITRIEKRRDVNRVLEQGGNGAVLALEDGAALAGSLGVLRMLFKLGFRSITLCWNGENALGDGAIGTSGRGLTSFGKAAVSEMQDLGMVVDVSHLAEKGFWDAMEITRKPIIASHSNAKEINDHPRNLSDAQITAIAKTGGVVGVNLFPDFLNQHGIADSTDVLRHIEHILSVGGEDAVGIGTDFDGMSSVAKGIENTQKLYILFDALSRMGYSDALIGKLSHKNFARVYSACLPI